MWTVVFIPIFVAMLLYPSAIQREKEYLKIEKQNVEVIGQWIDIDNDGEVSKEEIKLFLKGDKP
uniref:EF-hand domain-containing protein n=1 Tax=viral metagenome TaxID=1070528 RepID=A0A6M3KFY5_9ZZZZ